MTPSLKAYKKRRDFTKTPEPQEEQKRGREPIFVIQKHKARHLHYDFRLEVRGVLKSWAVPKGLPKAYKIKRLAAFTEDHPLSYADFEGTIPKGEYGAGTVEIYDKGTFENLRKKAMSTCIKEGKVEFRLHGKKYKGDYVLIRFREKNWLLMKMKKKIKME